MDNKLMQALKELDSYLDKKSLNLEVVVCGAFALQLHGFTEMAYTYDIDTIKKIDSDEILKAIETIGDKLGLDKNWLNDQASSVAIPKGTIDRAIPLKNWKAIKVFLISRNDLIKMKASAFSIRRDFTNKDWEDLVLMKPSKEEIEPAIEFLKKTNAPPKGAGKQAYNNFKETINDLQKLF